MLKAEPKNVLSSRYRLYDGEIDVGELRMSWVKERSEAVIDGHSVDMYREGTFSGAFILAANGSEIACAVKPSFWTSTFEVSFGNVTFELAKRGTFKSAFELRLEGTVVGSIERESIWKRTARANLPDDWPNALKVFILWLVLVIWQREAAAASG